MARRTASPPRLWWPSWPGLRLDEARALLEEALPLAERAGAPAAEAETRLNLAHVATMARDLDVVAREAERARSVVRAGGLAELEGGSLFLLALVDHWAGRFDNARMRCVKAFATFAHARHAVEAMPPPRQLWVAASWSMPLSHEARLQALEAQGHSLLTCVEVDRGDATAGRVAGDAGLRLAEEARDEWG